jgi:tetratricopeptide (TPR) repeat protein
MIQRKYADAYKTSEKIIQYTEYNAVAYFMSGLILEKMGDSLSAFSRYSEAEEKFRLRQAATPISDMHYEFVVLNRSMNLIFLRKENMAREVCVEYYEKYKKLVSKDWLDRVSKYDRAYYEHIFFN